MRGQGPAGLETGAGGQLEWQLLVLQPPLVDRRGATLCGRQAPELGVRTVPILGYFMALNGTNFSDFKFFICKMGIKKPS